MQVFDPDYCPVNPDKEVADKDDLSLRSDIQPLDRTKQEHLLIHCMTTDTLVFQDSRSNVSIVEMDTDNFNCDHNVTDGKECDIVSQATELLDRDPSPTQDESALDTLQACNAMFHHVSTAQEAQLDVSSYCIYVH